MRSKKLKAKKKLKTNTKLFPGNQPVPGKSKFRVQVTKDGVRFNIDHQGFQLVTSEDRTDSKAEKLRIRKWYARMLRVALKRLKESK